MIQNLQKQLSDQKNSPVEDQNRKVVLHETHISSVLLAGDQAWKIKKPIDLGFLDYSTLERRKHFCEEELRLNGRLAPELYLDVTPITGSLDKPTVAGDGPVLDYAVHMRRFPEQALLSWEATQGKVSLQDMDDIAEKLHDFHQQARPAPVDGPYGTPEATWKPMQDNFAAIAPLLDESESRRLNSHRTWALAQSENLQNTLKNRLKQGHVRELHGDLHLGNIARIDGRITFFDCIEFDPNLYWIDTLNELAFLVMDLEQRGLSAHSRRLLNRYLELSGDVYDLALLPWYKAYRAMVRAKVARIRTAQLQEQNTPGTEAEEALQQFLHTLHLAERESLHAEQAARDPIMILTHGLSGCGKSHIALSLAEQSDGHSLIRIRSDVERKRLYAGETDPTVLYGREAGRRTFQTLEKQASAIIQAGFTPIVDATFLGSGHRKHFLDLAHELGARLVIVDVQTPQTVLRDRILARLNQGSDPSDADLEVLDAQIRHRDPLQAHEADQIIPVDGVKPDIPAILMALRPAGEVPRVGIT